MPELNLGGWAVSTFGDPPTCAHVHPIGDLRGHRLDPGCWCHPELDDGGGSVPGWVHQVADGREVYEEGAPNH